MDYRGIGTAGIPTIAAPWVNRDEIERTMTSAVGPEDRKTVSHVAFGMIGGVIHRVQVWTEIEWALLPMSRRPDVAQPLPGLGMVAIEPLKDISELPDPYRSSEANPGSGPPGPIPGSPVP
jgi:hypothetical protein